jgi:DNA-binding response OmpR family regulator
MSPPKRKHRCARLLLVEPSAHRVEELSNLFSGPDFDCELTLKVEAALRILKERRMDAVVINADAEYRDGGMAALIRKLKADDADLKLIIFNGVHGKVAQRRFRRMGADGYLSKLSDGQALKRSVERVLNLK